MEKHPFSKSNQTLGTNVDQGAMEEVQNCEPWAISNIELVGPPFAFFVNLSR